MTPSTNNCCEKCWSAWTGKCVEPDCPCHAPKQDVDIPQHPLGPLPEAERCGVKMSEHLACSRPKPCPLHPTTEATSGGHEVWCDKVVRPSSCDCGFSSPAQPQEGKPTEPSQPVSEWERDTKSLLNDLCRTNDDVPWGVKADNILKHIRRIVATAQREAAVRENERVVQDRLAQLKQGVADKEEPKPSR